MIFQLNSAKNIDPTIVVRFNIFVPMMRTCAKMKGEVAASDRTRRRNVLRHILFKKQKQRK